MKLVQIKCNEDMVDLDLPIHLRNIKSHVTKHTSKAGFKQIKHLYSWVYGDSTIMCYGWITGKQGDENKHDIPPYGDKYVQHIDNSDTQLLYGDIFMIMKQSTIRDFDTSDYGLFYHSCFEGFDECNSSEDGSEDGSEYTDDFNFIVGDSIHDIEMTDEMGDEMGDVVTDEMGDVVTDEMVDDMTDEMVDVVTDEMVDDMSTELSDDMSTEMGDELDVDTHIYT
jgi:hypothetical protein